jgi:hypothetical protein
MEVRSQKSGVRIEHNGNRVLVEGRLTATKAARGSVRSRDREGAKIVKCVTVLGGVTVAGYVTSKLRHLTSPKALLASSRFSRRRSRRCRREGGTMPNVPEML